MRHLLLLLALSCALSSNLHHATWFAMADCVQYVVQAGDICYNIAQSYGISLDDLESWNPGINCANLQIGQVICVSDPDAPSPPPPAGGCIEYTVQAGDICYTIAQTYGISLEDFYSYNPGINCNNLQIGQVVCVSSPGSVPFSPPPPFTPPPPPSEYNGNVFMEYLGALYNGVTFSDVPINSNVDFYFILAFAIDYSTTPTPTNGEFQVWWQSAVLTPEAVKAIKAQYDNVKVMLSLGGDTVSGQSVLFTPTNTTTWVSNAVSSLTSLITEYDLDGIDINYEHFATDVTPEVFATCIGQLIGELKNNNVISVATIAPFDAVEAYYVELFEEYSSEIDYVNFQFYTYATSTSASQYVSYFNTAAAKYGGGSNMLASFNTASGIGPLPATVLSACEQLKASGQLPGIFVWSADNSLTYSPTFTYEEQAQALVASTSTLRSFVE